MPAEDYYHQSVVRALIKDGWTITGEQVFLEVRKRKMFIDIQAAKASENLVILVEVKGFENAGSVVEYLANTVGKYVLYRAVIKFNELAIPLFLAVPVKAYKSVLSEPLSRLMIQEEDIKLVVFDPDTEEITQWIP